MKDLYNAHIGPLPPLTSPVKAASNGFNGNGHQNGNGHSNGFVECSKGIEEALEGDNRLAMFGYTIETLSMLLLPMVKTQ